MCNRVSDPQSGLHGTAAAVETCHTELLQETAHLVGCLSAVTNPGIKGSKGSF